MPPDVIDRLTPGRLFPNRGVCPVSLLFFLFLLPSRSFLALGRSRMPSTYSPNQATAVFICWCRGRQPLTRSYRRSFCDGTRAATPNELPSYSSRASRALFSLFLFN